MYKLICKDCSKEHRQDQLDLLATCFYCDGQLILDCTAREWQKPQRVFVCSPYRDNPELNTQRALAVCRQLALEGYTPIAPHLYATRFLDDEDTVERAIGMVISKDLLRTCDALWHYGDRITEGMAAEIAYAQHIGIPVTNKEWPE